MSLKSNEFTKCLIQKNKDTILCLAKVTAVTEGQVFITFYGEEEQSEKSYKILGSYNPAVGDTVCMARINNSWLCLGKISAQYSGSSNGIPENHASKEVSYGTGTNDYYGHVKLSDDVTSESAAATGGIAATPKAVKTAYDLALKANNKIAASAYGSAESLEVPAKTITAITLDQWEIKSDDAFAFSGGGIKCPYDGYVLVTGNVYYESNGSSEECRRGAYIYKNGTEVQSQYLNFKTNSEGIVGSGVGIVQVNAGDVVTLHARQSVATTCIPNAKTTRLAMAYI